jgi:hypothetical protein
MFDQATPYPRQRRRRPTSIQKARIRLLHKNGIAAPRLAVMFNAPIQTIHNALVEPRPRRRPGQRLAEPLTDADLQEIAALYTSGWTIKQIADPFGVSCALVGKVLRYLNIPPHPHTAGGRKPTPQA